MDWRGTGGGWEWAGEGGLDVSARLYLYCTCLVIGVSLWGRSFTCIFCLFVCYTWLHTVHVEHHHHLQPQRDALISIRGNVWRRVESVITQWDVSLYTADDRQIDRCFPWRSPAPLSLFPLPRPYSSAGGGGRRGGDSGRSCWILPPLSVGGVQVGVPILTPKQIVVKCSNCVPLSFILRPSVPIPLPNFLRRRDAPLFSTTLPGEERCRTDVPVFSDQKTKDVVVWFSLLPVRYHSL